MIVYSTNEQDIINYLDAIAAYRGYPLGGTESWDVPVKAVNSNIWWCNKCPDEWGISPSGLQAGECPEPDWTEESL